MTMFKDKSNSMPAWAVKAGDVVNKMVKEHDEGKIKANEEKKETVKARVDHIRNKRKITSKIKSARVEEGLLNERVDKLESEIKKEKRANKLVKALEDKGIKVEGKKGDAPIKKEEQATKYKKTKVNKKKVKADIDEATKKLESIDEAGTGTAIKDKLKEDIKAMKATLALFADGEEEIEIEVELPDLLEAPEGDELPEGDEEGDEELTDEEKLDKAKDLIDEVKEEVTDEPGEGDERLEEDVEEELEEEIEVEGKKKDDKDKKKEKKEKKEEKEEKKEKEKEEKKEKKEEKKEKKEEKEAKEKKEKEDKKKDKVKGKDDDKKEKEAKEKKEKKEKEAKEKEDKEKKEKKEKEDKKKKADKKKDKVKGEDEEEEDDEDNDDEEAEESVEGKKGDAPIKKEEQATKYKKGKVSKKKLKSDMEELEKTLEEVKGEDEVDIEKEKEILSKIKGITTLMTMLGENEEMEIEFAVDEPTKAERLESLKAKIKEKRADVKKKLKADRPTELKKITKESVDYREVKKRPKEVTEEKKAGAEMISDEGKKIFDQIVKSTSKLSKTVNEEKKKLADIKNKYLEPKKEQSKAAEEAIRKYYEFAGAAEKINDMVKLTEDTYVAAFERLKDVGKKFTKEEQVQLKSLKEKVNEASKALSAFADTHGKFSEKIKEIHVQKVTTSIEDMALVADQAEAIEDATNIMHDLANDLNNLLKIGQDIEEAIPMTASKRKKIEGEEDEYLSFEELPEEIKQSFQTIIYHEEDSENILDAVKDITEDDTLTLENLHESFDTITYDQDTVSKSLLENEGIYGVLFDFSIKGNKDYLIGMQINIKKDGTFVAVDANLLQTDDLEAATKNNQDVPEVDFGSEGVKEEDKIGEYLYNINDVIVLTEPIDFKGLEGNEGTLPENEYVKIIEVTPEEYTVSWVDGPEDAIKIAVEELDSKGELQRTEEKEEEEKIDL